MKVSHKRNLIQRQIFKAQELGYDWWLLIIVGFICLSGIAFLASSLSTENPVIFRRELFKQLVLGLGVGSIIAFFLARTDYHFWFENSKWLLLINFLGLGFLGFFALYSKILTFNLPQTEAAIIRSQIINSFSKSPVSPYLAGGAIRWISLPFLPNFQPSEFAKLALLIYFGSFFNKFENKKISWITLKKPVYAFLASSFLIMLQPDLGTILIIFGILAASMWSAKIPFKILGYLGIVVIIFAVIMSFSESYRISRVTAFLNPESENATQIRHAQRAIRNGGLLGKGYGKSELKQQPGFLYEQSTDAIIAIIGEEVGFVGTSLFLLLYMIFLLRGLKVAQQAPDLGGQSLATGITVWIVGQAFINISGMTGLIPLKGVPLPFVSEGGSSLFINLLAIGVLMNISKQATTTNLNRESLRYYSRSKLITKNQKYSSKTLVRGSIA